MTTTPTTTMTISALVVKFTATFADAAASDAALAQVKTSPAAVAGAISTDLYTNSASAPFVGVIVTVQSFEAGEEGAGADKCAGLTGHDLEHCKHAHGNTAAVVGGVLGGLAVLAFIVWKCRGTKADKASAPKGDVELAATTTRVVVSPEDQGGSA